MAKMSREQQSAEKFRKMQQNKNNDEYVVATESMTVNDKLKVLNEMGKPELIDLFKDWKPRVSNKKKRGAPLDQRVSITVTAQERTSLDNELKTIKKLGEKISMSQFIRNKALGSVDINGWKDKAEKALKEIEEIEENEKDLKSRKLALTGLIDEEDDEDASVMYLKEINDINAKLSKIVAQGVQRNNRLSGRMSMAESETVKWRAQRLCISSSDFLRFVIFSLEPDSPADAHLSLEAKKRFYISIIEVAQNGWGSPPEIYECAQCQNYIEEIRRLRSEIEQLRSFS